MGLRAGGNSSSRFVVGNNIHSVLHMTKKELLQKLDALLEHEDCDDYKLAIDVAFELIRADLSDLTDWDVQRAYDEVVKFHQQ